MSIYRDDDEALALRGEQSQRLLQASLAERATLLARYATAQAAAERDEARLEAAGDGGGDACATRDRAALMPVLLLTAGLLCLPLCWAWARALRSEPSVAPALLLLGVPGLLAALVAWPYRRQRSIAVLIGIGALQALVPLSVLGRFLVERL